MTSYAILSDRVAPGGDEAARVIADRFSWAGFVFGGFWLLWHRARVYWGKACGDVRCAHRRS